MGDKLKRSQEKGFPDIRLSGIRQSDFCLSTYAYHTFAYQDLCLSEAEFEIRTIAHQGGTSAYQKLKYFCEYFCLCLYCLHIAKLEWRNKERETLWKRSKPYRFATYQRIFQNPALHPTCMVKYLKWVIWITSICITFYATCDPPHFRDAGQVFKEMFFSSKNVCFTLAQNAG